MTKKQKFLPILGDLSRLNPQEQQDYVLAACDFLQVPPELGLVGLSLMDTGDGARQLLLYVRRGATDIIRDRLKISVDSLVPTNGDGYVGFTAQGHDSGGRQEIAVGAASIKGLSGTAVANAVKTAQTQALRRMTLQFAGGGFLDSTELGEKTTDIMSSASSLQQISAQPAVSVNTEAGKDVTISEVPSKTAPNTTEKSVVPEAVAKESEQQSVPLGTSSVEKEQSQGAAAPIGAQSSETAPQPVKRPRGRPRKVVSLDTPSSISEAQVPASPSPHVEPVATQEQVLSEQKAEEVAAVVLAAPVIPPSDKILGSNPSAVEAQQVPGSTGTEGLNPSASSNIVERPSDGGMIPTPEQRMAYTKRLSVYVNDTLPKGGFLQSEKLGGRNDQMMKFFNIMFPQVNRRNMSIQQWDDYFELMDTKLTELGEKGLVQLIYEKIDPKKESANA